MTFRAALMPLSADRRAAMLGRSQHPGLGCPSFDELVEVHFTHLGFDGQPRAGVVIVAASLGAEVLAIWGDLFSAGFCLERARPMSDYAGDDDRSMADNNCSAFNCRLKTGSLTELSAHALGRAIDINPVQNPYVRGQVVLPPSGRAYAELDRAKVPEAPKRGVIYDGGAVVRAFESRGWRWGGRFASLKDWHHFEKPSEAEHHG